jgi:hypothetical protein
MNQSTDCPRELYLLVNQSLMSTGGQAMNATEREAGDRESGAGRWQRIRTTFGPTAAGLLGGALSGLAVLQPLEPLCNNVARTYADYPSLEPPFVAVNFGLPAWVTVMALAIGFAAPIATGALAVWLVKPRDLWADLSTGLAAAMACTLSSFVTCIGWAVVLALVVVPSISDLTLLSDSVRAPAPTAAGLPIDHPANALSARYPDLERVKPDERGQKFMPKIVSDQVSGGFHSVWVGMLVALLTAGSLAMSGTLAAGYLMRRADGFARSIVPYLEITMPLTVAIALVFAIVLSPVWNAHFGENFFGFGLLTAASVVLTSILMVLGAIRRWPWLPRLCLVITWLILLTQPGRGAIHWILPIMSGGLTLLLLVRLIRDRSQRLAAATP